MYAPSVETNPHLGVPRPSSVQSHGFAAQNPCPTSGLPAKHIKLLKWQALEHPCWIEVLQVDQKFANPKQWRGVQYLSFSLRASRSFPTLPELERAHYSPRPTRGIPHWPWWSPHGQWHLWGVLVFFPTVLAVPQFWPNSPPWRSTVTTAHKKKTATTLEGSAVLLGSNSVFI